MSQFRKNSKISPVKSVAEKVPKAKILSVPVIILLLLWKSEGVTIADLNRGDVNYRNTIYGFIGIGALSCIYSVGVATVGLAGIKLPALMQSILATIILITWLLGAPVMSASIEQLSHTQYIRLNGIDTLYLLTATGLGFALLAVCLIDVLLGFQSMRRSIDQESKEFTREMSQSKSVMMAVRSGQSFAEAKRTSNKSITKPVDDTSPLKNYEVGQDQD
ncbi:uncharacterized protein LOC135331955 isoform X2 [Halichondria panicea]|uniref:uncharacterized protein LOC135331955 isoform X2 n=1 Tax=Halichondria panicea TaxID=6063 RepID=UPI00312B86F9